MLIDHKSEILDYLKEVFAALVTRSQRKLKYPTDQELAVSLIEWVKSHHLQSLFLYAIDKTTIPQEIRQSWEKIKRTFLLENLKYLNAGVTFCRIAEDAGIKCVVTRGLALLLSDYPDIWIRQMGDIDILIDKKDKLSVYTCFMDNDILPYKQLRSQYVYKIHNARIELHWSYLTSKRFNYRMDTSEFLMGRQKIITQDGFIYRLSPEHEFIGLVCHAVIHHSLTIFKQLIDIALYIAKPDLDWGYIANWCKRNQMTRMFVFAIALVAAVFDLNIQSIAETFGIDLDKRKKYIDHHVNIFFRNEISDYFTHKKNMIYLAETPRSMLGSFFRIFSLEEYKDLKLRYFNKKG